MGIASCTETPLATGHLWAGTTEREGLNEQMAAIHLCTDASTDEIWLCFTGNCLIPLHDCSHLTSSVTAEHLEGFKTEKLHDQLSCREYESLM